MRRPLVTRFVLSTFVVSSVVLAIACGGDDSVSPGNDDAGAVVDASHDATVDQSAPDSSGCSGGTVACGGACIDTKVDPSNCGACAKVCAKGELCSTGTCATSCGTGLTECGGDAGVDLCISTKTDNANCGACGNACPSGTACTNGACELTCQSGSNACPVTVVSATPDGGAPDASADGGDAGAGTQTKMVCTDLDDDNANCGACGTVCASGTVCKAGHCEVSCGAGTTLCDADAGAKCVDEKSDNTNCGGCGVTCAAGEACSNGACSTTCGGSLTKCTTASGSTCNDTSSDPANCGSCGNACAAGEACKAGVCGTFCNNKVLYLGGTDSTTDGNLAAALQAYGVSLTVVGNGSATYDGATPPIAGFGAVYVDPGKAIYSTPAMPTAGQQAILDAFNAGKTGVVLSGPMNFFNSAASDPVLAPLILFGGNGHHSPGNVTASSSHPIWNGITSPFATGGNFLICDIGCTTPPTATNIANGGGGGQDFASVIDGPGRSVSFGWVLFADAFDWQGQEPSVVHMIANSLKWSARCDVPSK